MLVSKVLKELTSIPSPSGFESRIKKTITHFLSPYTDSIKEDIRGNLICTKLTKKTDHVKTLMFIAHMDEVGFMITYIEENGFIRFTNIGGIDVHILKGSPVQILHNDIIVNGVIGVKPAHMKKESKHEDYDFSDLWIDIGVKNKEEALRFISVGDCAVIKSDYMEMPNNLISCRGCDDKSGIVALIKMMEILSDNKCPNNIVVVFSVQEEIGLRGAKTSSYNISPDICIAVDVAHATDYPTINKAKYGDIRLGNGPVIPFGQDFTVKIQKKLIDIAEKFNLKYQTLALSNYSGTDVNAVGVSKGGCMTGLLSIPCRHMHTPIEIVSLTDINDVGKILADFCKLN